MNAVQMVRRNNELRKQLDAPNLKVYEDALVYVRLSRLSEFETESLLLEMLEHVLEAQQNGKSAEDVFGNDLKSYCDELIDNIPGEKKRVSVADYFSYGFLTLGWMFVVNTIFHIIGIFYPQFAEYEVSVIPYLAAFVLTFFAIIALLFALKKSVYDSRLWFIAAIVLWIADIAVFVLLSVWFKEVWTLTMNVWISGGITLGAFVAVYLLKQISKSMDGHA